VVDDILKAVLKTLMMPPAMRQLAKTAAVLAMVIGGVVAYVEVQDQRERARIPELLHGVSVGAGWWGGCPPRSQSEAEDIARLGFGVSPEFDRRLTERFPPGSPETALVQALTAQGFAPASQCENDSSVHVASFGPTPGAFLRFPVSASAYWKSEAGQIVWTKGFFFITGF
jgi:hypothetical protein